MPPAISRTHFAMLLLAAVGLASPHAPAKANDANAALAAGGIVPLQSTTIRMESEDLVISPERIRVTYRFRNLSDQPQHVLVAFPFASGPVGGDVEFTIPWDRPAEIFKFKVWVDGKEVTPRYEMKRLDDGQSGSAAANGPPQGSAEYEAIWEQDYAPNQVVTVEHEYVPIIGSSMEPPSRRELHRNWCMGKPPPKLREYTAQNVRYIVQTAKTWAGPIGHFRLTILPRTDTYSRRPQIPSLCGFRMKRIEANRYVFEARDFVPMRDLDIIFLSPLPDNIVEDDPASFSKPH